MKRNDGSGALPEEVTQGVLKRRQAGKLVSIEPTDDAKKAEMASSISEVLSWFTNKPAETDDEVEERIEAFFRKCSATGELPTVEKMCLALGTVRQRVWEWENGSKGKRRADSIKRAKQALAAIDAELVSKNKIPQVTYIFRSKNFYEMRDQTDVVITPNNPIDNMEPDEGRKRLIDAVPEE